MTSIDPTSIAAFLERHERDIGWIIRDTGGLWERADVESEAYVAVADLCAASGQPLDLAVEEHAARLLQHLRRIARRAGGNVRVTLLRPDQAGSGEDWTPGAPGWDRLAADDGEHPLSLLEGLEEEYEPRPISPMTLDAYHSPYAGWIWLLERFNRRMSDAAAFLLISPSWGYACRNKAAEMLSRQHPLPRPTVIGDDDALRPWRKFKLPSRHTVPPPQQQSIDFWARPPNRPQGRCGSSEPGKARATVGHGR